MDHRPELIGSLGQIVIVRHGELRSEEKVPDRVLVKHPVNKDPVGMALKVDPVIAAAVAVEGPPIPLDLSEVLPIEGIKICGQDLELREQVELEVLGKSAHLGGTDGIKDDLEHVGQAKRNMEIRKSGKNPQRIQMVVEPPGNPSFHVLLQSL